MTNKPKIYLTNKETGERYLIVGVDKAQDQITLHSLSNGTEFVSHLSKVNQALYSIETEDVAEPETVVAEVATEVETTEVVQEPVEQNQPEGMHLMSEEGTSLIVPIQDQIVTATEAPISNAKMTRKQAKVVIDAMKAEASVFLSNMVEMEASLMELNGGVGEAKKLSLAVTRLQNWVDS